ncbi:hypothetical protein PFICI_10471 [Pestalotiopsis fici W106-1]|uniref:Opioid growth factor receptor (OGFr) conserved domain-containing protein n=1 Tax=Pestalotiopsis fici (strain W106-1 / CGMCC3.15140) TaxID=1229662 RepID=W3WX85_PESFW|nr:uncharacterized protein PFICI_10471 [Pestalotiopsis fici W106-1]ETS78409.1 hypothetical protein PFICI_10471 [Pestalotiopsis fici W106-1]
MSILAQVPSRPAMQRLVDFYHLKSADHRGRDLEHILKWSDRELESCHDYVQTLFPLPEGSLFAHAPIIDEETYLYWREHEDLKRNLRRAFDRMLVFYGLEWEQGDNGPTGKIIEKEGAKGNLSNWVVPMDHNHLRITRIIRSLRILGLDDEAKAYHDALDAICNKYGKVGSTSRTFWKRALTQPLHIAPDGTQVAWLKKYEP